MSDRPSMVALEKTAGMVGDVAQLLLPLGAAYIVIVVRNTPELGQGSDQAVASNMPPADTLRVLRWLADDIERKAAERRE